jgi:hypothetical protein
MYESSNSIHNQGLSNQAILQQASNVSQTTVLCLLLHPEIRECCRPLGSVAPLGLDGAWLREVEGT